MVKADRKIFVVWNDTKLHITNSIKVAVDFMGPETNYKTYYSFLDRWKNKEFSRVYDTGLFKCQRFRDLEDLKNWTKLQLYQREQEVRRLEVERTELSGRKDQVVTLIEDQFETVTE